jgi:hypothetical protein
MDISHGQLSSAQLNETHRTTGLHQQSAQQHQHVVVIRGTIRFVNFFFNMLWASSCKSEKLAAAVFWTLDG